ncbi:mini-ribonuclease 3 [Clostridia bacterium]|nr:mini-ribonuclease 3 [Clostridia bacterium]
MDDNNVEVTAKDLREYSPRTLAYLGDAVFELMVRAKFVSNGNAKVHALNRQTVSVVRATSQSKSYETLLPRLTEEEAAVLRRGKNAVTKTGAKSASYGQYSRATGVEALFGWLYLKGETMRIKELSNIILKEAVNEQN